MNRRSYWYGIFFLSLYVIIACFQSKIFFQIDYRIYQLSSYANWSLALIGTALIGTLFTLKYYHHKGYTLVFTASVISIITSLFQHISFYVFVLKSINEVPSYYIAAVFSSLGAVLLYALSLTFSKARKNVWLRTLGIFMLIVGISSIYAAILGMGPQTAQSISTETTLNQWISLAGSFVPVPLIVLFYNEVKSLKEHNPVSGLNSASILSYAVKVSAVIIIIVFGLKLSVESSQNTSEALYRKSLAELFEARTYKSSTGKSLLYRLLKPQNYNPEKRYPLVVSLHGGTGWGTDNQKQLSGALFPRMLSRQGNREKYPAFLFVPQCPSGTSWGGFSNFRAIDSLVLETIEALEQEFAIDRDRIYVTGHSLGGYGAWNFIGKYPNKFAAAIPAAGVGDPDLASNMVDVPIWAFHGANDRNVPVSGSRNMIKAIQNAGGHPRYTESPDGGHGWKIVENTPGVLEWLFAQKRE